MKKTRGIMKIQRDLFLNSVRVRRFVQFFGKIILSVDFFLRYSSIIDNIDDYDRKVLDVGSGALGIGYALHGRKIVCVDISDVVKTALGEKIKASATNLPFKDGAFDVSVSADMLEHVLGGFREKVCSELKRVSSRKVLLHCPIGEQSLKTDLRLLATLHKIFGSYHENILEHIDSGTVTFSFLRASFSGCSFKPTLNCNVLYVLGVIGSLPIINLLTGIFYLLIIKRFDGKPPYYGYMISFVASKKPTIFRTDLGKKPHMLQRWYESEPT